jgi:Zn-dependent protease
MFRNSLKLFSIAGFEVKVHASWIIILLLITWSLATGYFPFAYPDLGVGGYWLMGFISALLLFVSVLIHELMHSLVARRHNLTMKGITLFLFGGVAEMADEPPTAKAEFQIAIVGPLTSILIGLLSYGLYLFSLAADLPAMLRGILFYSAFINVLLAIFNLIPAFPLDGGRVLRAFFWHVKGNLRWATRVAAGIGSGFSFLLMFLGLMNIFLGNLVGGLWWILIGIFLNGAAAESRREVEVRAALKGEPIRRFMRPHPVTVAPSISVRTSQRKSGSGAQLAKFYGRVQSTTL